MATDLYRWIYEHRIRLGRAILWGGGVLAALTVIGALVVLERPVDRQFWIVYTAPLFLVGPLWLRLRLAELPPRPNSAPAVDIAVFGLGIIRFLTAQMVPFSGHMLFLTYSILVTGAWWYRALGAAMLVGTSAFKLGLWDDAYSWAWGGGLGIAAAALHWLLVRRVR